MSNCQWAHLKDSHQGDMPTSLIIAINYLVETNTQPIPVISKYFQSATTIACASGAYGFPFQLRFFLTFFGLCNSRFTLHQSGFPF
jgi:hypothetical protein